MPISTPRSKIASLDPYPDLLGDNELIKVTAVLGLINDEAVLVRRPRFLHCDTTISV